MIGPAAGRGPSPRPGLGVMMKRVAKSPFNEVFQCSMILVKLLAEGTKVALLWPARGGFDKQGAFLSWN